MSSKQARIISRGPIPMNSHTPNHQSDGDSEQVNQPRPQAGPDELLSSYLDGELSVDETAAVEAHLEVSEESRRALQDLRSLSNYLSNFPVEPIPEDPVVSAGASKGEAPGTRSRRLPLIAAAVAAAVLVIFAVVPGDPESPPMMVASHNAPAPKRDQPLAEANEMSDVQPDFTNQMVAGGGFGSAEAAGGGLVLPKSLDKAQVGQILSAVDFSDGEAVVVRLTVVDIEQGLDSLRLLLQKHHIARADAIAAVTGDRARTELPKGPQPSTDQLVSVVVQASPRQVSDAMSQLRREVQAEVKLAGVLRVAALETAPGGRRALSRLNAYGSDIARSPRFAASRRSKPTDGKRELRARSATRDASALASAQVRLDLPARLMQKVNRTTVDIKRSEAKRGKQADRRMQVVFVLVTPPQPATPPGPDPDGAA